jgi:hypothetical protein
MKLTSDRGREIRKNYSESKEKEICNIRGLSQVGGSRTKIDGTNGVLNESIKNFTGNSTQVHLTTQRKFINVLNLDEQSEKFIRMFCGNETLNINGNDRYLITEIDDKYLNSFLSFLNENKFRVIDLIISNGFDITSIVYKDLKNDKLHVITYGEIIDKVENCSWIAKKGGIHLKNQKGKTYFHIQREGKKNKNNRYNVLFHIHRNLFLVD